MIVSKARHAYIYNTLYGVLILMFACIPFYFDDPENKKQYIFNPESFKKVISIVFLICTAVMLFFVGRKKKVTISGSLIEVQQFFGFKEEHFDASEIKDFKWGNGGASETSSISDVYLEVEFKDGAVLFMDAYDYDNLYEIRDWFYSYCAAHGIIEIESAAAIKMKRVQRKKMRRGQKSNY